MLFPGKFVARGPGATDASPAEARRLSPERLLAVIGMLLPWLFTGAVVMCALGFYVGFFVAPTAPSYGNVYRIIYVHVPATWMAVLLYMVLAGWAGAGLVFRFRLAPMVAEALAPTGAMFAFLALWTGSLWGKPIWGAWWVWDMRLVADLALVFLYLAIIALNAGIEDPRRADRLVAMLAVVGALVVAAALASVALWPAPRPTAAVGHSDARSNSITLVGLCVVAAGYLLYAGAAALTRLRCVILERERQSDWATQWARHGR